MKKSLIALAALAAVSAASAQSTLTISGSVAGAFERQSTAGAKTGITGYDASSNNITFKGVEDLGGGLKAGFELNKRFNTATGNTAGSTSNNAREFENSSLFLESAKLGKLSMGRMLSTSWASYDPFGGLGTDMSLDSTGVNNSTGTVNYAYNAIVGSRKDSMLAYASPVYSGFKLSLATTVNPSVNTGKEYIFGRIDYSNGPLNLSAAQDKSATLVGVAQVTNKQVAGSYDFGFVKTALVWGKAGATAARTSVHATVPVNASVNLLASYRTKGAALNTSYALGADYLLSKRTTAFAHYGDSDNNAQAAYRIGVRHTF